MTPLLVLAGGFGTRLQPAVSGIPKALAPVGDTLFLSLQIQRWREQGQRSFIFLLHHEADRIVDFLESEELLAGCDVRWVIEPRPMDTGGAVAHAISKLELAGDFLLANADTWLGGGLQQIRGADAPAIAIVSQRNASRYGLVDLDDGDTVLAFAEKGSFEGPGWINAGLGKFDTRMFAGWDGEPFSIERLLLPRLVGERRLRAVKLAVEFVDIGVPDDYYRFCRWIQLGRGEALCN